MRLKEFLTENENDYRSIIKPLNMKKLRPFHDQPKIVRYASMSPKGKTILNFEINPNMWDKKTQREFKGFEVWGDKVKSKTFTKASEAIAYAKEVYDNFMKTNTDAPASDAEIVKWLTNQLAEKVTLKDIQGMPYVKWPKEGIQLTRESFPWLIFVNGQEATDDYAGLGNINMTSKDFEEWLKKNGAREVPRKKTKASSSYYD